jgi:hypothetical protein
LLLKYTFAEVQVKQLEAELTQVLQFEEQSTQDDPLWNVAVGVLEHD